MTPLIRNGWLIVPYSGPELARVFIAVGDRADAWRPAYLDWHDGRRVAKVRPPEPTGRARAVWLRIDDTATRIGKVVL